jgi:hypothetical protein
MSDGAGIQFERAEFDTSPAQTACAECSAPFQACYYDVNGAMVCEKCRYAIEERLTRGSSVARFARATAAGVVAAILGALLDYAIAALTGYEFGLIAILVGFTVGAAVRWGANGRGGWPYQGLAIGLTYLAIVSTYIPGLAESSNADGAIIPLALLLALACVAPFLAGVENIIGLIIIGIGLYEAWRLNRRTELTISGPHLLTRTPASLGG